MASKWGNNIWNLVLCKTGELDFLIDAFFIIAKKEYKILESNVLLRKKNLHCANRIFMVTRVNSHCANRIFKLFIRRNSLRKKNGQIWWSLRLLRIFVSLRKKNLSFSSESYQKQIQYGSFWIPHQLFLFCFFFVLPKEQKTSSSMGKSAHLTLLQK